MEVTQGENVLMLAVRANNLTAVIKHINRGVNLEHKNVRGKTALYMASDFGYSDIVSALLNAGADSNVENTIGWKPLDIAGFKGHKKVVDILKNHNYEKEKGLIELYRSII